MEPLTLEQNKQLSSWASQRDSILIEIARKKEESEKLVKINNDLGISNTEISNKIQQSIGRLLELDKREEERAMLVSAENAALISRKSILQTEVSSLELEISALKENKKNLHDDIQSITKIHESVFARTSEIERIVGETVSINSANAREIKNILVDAGIELKKIIDIASENVDVTNQAIQKIPKIIVDLHRDVVERRKAARAKIS